MSDYSGYQIKRTYYQGPFATVHEAAAPNGLPGRYALKIFHPPASTHIRRAYAIEGWLLAAERQQKAFKKDGAVLEVMAFGRCPEGAYMVTPWQERSFEPLVANLAAKGDLLRAVAELLFNALEQWGTQTGGSHRKLKPANIFLTKSGPLAGATAMLSDPWFLLGVKSDTPRTNDLAAVGAILAQIVRRREVAAWPIEDAPEWKALGRPGKAWLAYINYLMDPQPASGELTLAEARKRLRAIPKDSNPVRSTLIISGIAAVVVVGGLFGFARFGNPEYMPGPIYKLAENVGNPLTRREAPSPDWAPLCRAWDTWLGDLQGNASRLLRNEKLWSGPNDPLRVALRRFVAEANRIKPGALVEEAQGETRMAVLAEPAIGSPLYERLRLRSVQDRVSVAMNGGQLEEGTPEIQGVRDLTIRLETWPRWDEMRELVARLEARGFTRAVGALQPKLPPAPTPGYKIDIARTLKLFNDLSLDENGTLLLASRWAAITKVRVDMEGTAGDRVQNAMPRLILDRLRDTGSIGNFAESLGEPLDELNQRRARFLDPQVVQARFLAESELLKESAEVTTADFPRWEEQLALFSKVLSGDDPRLAANLDDSVRRLAPQNVDLEDEAPEAEPGGPATLSRTSFEQELANRRTEMQTLRAREIVRIDLPVVRTETAQLDGRLQDLERRLEATLVLLRPETWLAKVRQAYGQFNETRQRWATWQQAAVPAAVTADSLRGLPNRQKFRALRQQERQVKEFINGLEGPEGLGALAVPDLAGVSPETATVLRQLEAARREQAAAAAAAAVEWRNALPQVAWAAAGATVREPIQAHRQWLADLPAFATDLDRLGELLAGGFSWTEVVREEGVGEVAERLARRPGVDALTGKPAESFAEAKLLGQLVQSTDRPALVAAAQSGRLSRMLTAWRRLGTLAGWPANAADLDIDGGVVESLRKIVPETVQDGSRRARLLDELGRETRVRWNRAARNSAANIDQMTAVFERMARYNIAETDLEEKALFNFKLWQLKRSDWSEVDLAPLRTRRDDFVRSVRGIAGAMSEQSVSGFVQELANITLVVDPNHKPTPSPRTAKWTEELTNAGRGLTATWRAGGKTVKLEFQVVEPPGDLPPFYLAKRPIAVGEFIDLMATRSTADVEAVVAKMPVWAARETISKPANTPVSWRPVVTNNGRYDGFEVNPSWFTYPGPTVKELIDNPTVMGQLRPLTQMVSEVPTARSPLQYVSPEAAKIFSEKILGARLPTTREWEAVLQVAGTPAAGNFRGPNFQELFEFLRNYTGGGLPIQWRPNEGAFRPRVGGANFVDDGRSSGDRDESRFWFTSVDEGPATGGFVNLTGNVSIFLEELGTGAFYVAGGSVLSPPGVDFNVPQKVAGGLVGGKAGTEAFADVGLRPAFDAPPGFKERFRFLELVRKQGFLTW
jgi:hypothetical protein